VSASPEIADKTGPKQRGRPFQKGRSGNPQGRPLGARNRTTVAVEALLDGEAEKLTRKAVTLALEGNVACLRPVPRADCAATTLSAGVFHTSCDELGG